MFKLSVLFILECGSIGLQRYKNQTRSETLAEVATLVYKTEEKTLQPRVLLWLQTKKKCILIIIILHLT